MRASSFASAVAGACIAISVSAGAARADDRRAPIDCAAADIAPAIAVGLHSLSVEAPPDVVYSMRWSAVALALIVGTDGVPSDVHVEKSSGFLSVDNAITDAVREHWRYVPARKDGEPIACALKTAALWGQKPAPEVPKPTYTVLHIPASEYPAAILAKKEEGTVVLLVYIDDDDKTVKAKVVIPSKFADLDVASIEYVMHRAHLAAARINGSPAKTVIYLDVEWSLAPPKAVAGADVDEDPTTAKLMIAEASPSCSRAVVDAGPAEFAKRGAILLEHDGTTATPPQLDGIKLLADDLSNAIREGAKGVQLRGYGGDAWDLSPGACKLSLDRAMAIRQLLIDDGVKENTIEVVAMGGATDLGEPDRVDIYVWTK